MPFTCAGETIGSWDLRCQDRRCGLAYRERLFDKGGISAGLEIRAREKDLVPAVVVSGLPDQPVLAAALGDRVKVTMRLDGSAAAELICGADAGGYVCAPGRDSAASLAASLPAAKAITIHVSVDMGNGDASPSRAKTLELSGTRDALAHLMAAGVPRPATQSPTVPSGWVSLLDRGLKAVGYQNGTADLPSFIARYFRH